MTTRSKLERAFLTVLRQIIDTNDCSHTGADGLLIAVSGGIDSTALLRLSVGTAKGHDRKLVAAHVNHGIRPDAMEEEVRLRALCGDLGVEFVCARLRRRRPGGAGAGHSPTPPPSPSEQTLRAARYAALRRMARASGCRWVLLGHQRDDQAETLLLNLVRGAGLRGLAGMPRRRGIFVRPLLAFSRHSLQSYLELLDVPWVEDPTNRDLSIARNRIRRQILPLLESEVRPRATAAIARAAEHLQRALAALEEQAEACLTACSVPSPETELRLDPVRLRSYHRGLVEFALRRAVARVRGSTTDIAAPLLATVTDHCIAGRPGIFRISQATVIESTDRWVRVGREGTSRPGTSRRGAQGSARQETRIPRTGYAIWGPGRMQTRAVPLAGVNRIRVLGLERLQIFDLGEVHFPVLLRGPRPGDRLTMEDGQGSRKLSDLLSEAGVPRSLRPGQPVLEDANGILWAPGIRRAARALVSKRTQRIWIVHWTGPLPCERAIKGGSSRG